MVEHPPSMSIECPPARESDLHEEMTRRATPPWSRQPHDPLGKPPKEGCFYFHRDAVEDEQACTVCIRRDRPGRWLVQLTADELGPIPVQQYKRILRAFEAAIADPAATAVGGMAAIGISYYRLDDYFSPAAVDLLRRFCSLTNGNRAHHSDQERWIAFLTRAHQDGHRVHCDVFGEALRNAQWCPKRVIPSLVSEYDFALDVLEKYDRETILIGIID